MLDHGGSHSCAVLTGSEGEGCVICILGVTDSEIQVTFHRRSTSGELEVCIASDSAEVIVVGRAPGFHDGNHEEDEQIRPKQVSLLDPDYGVHYRRGAIDIKLDFDCRVQGLQKGHKFGGTGTVV